jgi:DNA mismatch repair protein MutS
MSIYEQYISYHQQYTAIYGNKTIVLCQVGSFFELYSVENDLSIEGPNLSEICSILNIQMTRKNKSIPECSRSNPYLAGIPCVSLKKYTDILLKENYTIVLVEQVTAPPNPERKVTQILSPGTSLDYNQSFDSNFLMCFYVTKGSTKFAEFTCLSVSFMDLTTGETFVYRVDETQDAKILLQEANRVLTTYGPKELLIVYDKDDISDNIINHFDQLPICIKKVESTPTFQKISYQNTVLRKVFDQACGLLSPIEYVDLERDPNDVVCFCYLLDFAYQHNEKIIQKLYKPKIIVETQYLQLTNNVCYHLDILPRSDREGAGCLSSLLNTCQTAIGKRFFKECLLQPLCDPVEIRKRYDAVEAFLQNDLYKSVAKALGEVKDVERLFRRLSLHTIQPVEMEFLLSSLQIVMKVHTMCDVFPSSHFADPLKTLVDFCNQRWDLSNQENIYKKGVVAEIDEKMAEVKRLEDIFKDIVDHANALVESNEFKLETTSEREEYQIIITKKRFETYSAKFAKNRTAPVFDSQPLSAANKTVYKLSFEGMEKSQKRLNHARSELRSIVKTKFDEDITFLQTFFVMIKDVVEYIKHVDVFSTAAKNAVKFNYCKPTIATTHEKSFISAKDVRHPLIEVYQTDTAYVANDVELKGESMLLYGINASGKSSYMKSVGINIILAQSGFYTAASDFTFSPYHKLFTRVPSSDNLFRQQSSFTVEMNELRSILKNADKHSLVIGDEICSTSESQSSISIVSASIVTLSQRESSFIFATHLHEVQDIEQVKGLKNLSIFHMSVNYDESTNILTYDRKLKKGKCSSLYGLEVCKSLQLPADFLLLANRIRQSQLQIHETIVAPNVSRYSSDVFVDMCSVCKKAKAQEVHHVQEQHTADKNGFIGYLHKNHRSNLMPLCEKCHDEIHNNGKNEKEKDKEKDSTDIDQQIHKLKSENKSNSFIAKELNISLYKVQKMLKK